MSTQRERLARRQTKDLLQAPRLLGTEELILVLATSAFIKTHLLEVASLDRAQSSLRGSLLGGFQHRLQAWWLLFSRSPLPASSYFLEGNPMAATNQHNRSSLYGSPCNASCILLEPPYSGLNDRGGQGGKAQSFHAFAFQWLVFLLLKYTSTNICDNMNMRNEKSKIEIYFHFPSASVAKI